MDERDGFFFQLQLSGLSWTASPSEACVSLCAGGRTLCYPHLDLGLNKTTVGNVFLGFVSFPYVTDPTVLCTLWILYLPLPLRALGPFLPPPPAPAPPPPPPPHPSFSPPALSVPLFSNWCLTDWQRFLLPSFLPPFLPSFLPPSLPPSLFCFVFCCCCCPPPPAPIDFQVYRWCFSVAQEGHSDHQDTSREWPSVTTRDHGRWHLVSWRARDSLISSVEGCTASSVSVTSGIHSFSPPPHPPPPPCHPLPPLATTHVFLCGIYEPASDLFCSVHGVSFGRFCIETTDLRCFIEHNSLSKDLSKFLQTARCHSLLVVESHLCVCLHARAHTRTWIDTGVSTQTESSIILFVRMSTHV